MTLGVNFHFVRKPANFCSMEDTMNLIGLRKVSGIGHVNIIDVSHCVVL